jgi:hypothetical protein
MIPTLLLKPVEGIGKPYQIVLLDRSTMQELQLKYLAHPATPSIRQRFYKQIRKAAL